MQLGFAVHRTMHVDQVTKFVHRGKRHFPIKEAEIRSIEWVCREEADEDAVLDREVITVRLGFPVMGLDQALLRELIQPVNHLVAHPNGKLSGLSAIVFTIVLGNQEVLIFALGKRNAPRDRRPTDGAAAEINRGERQLDME